MKIKLLTLAVALVAVCSAFTTTENNKVLFARTYGIIDATSSSTYYIVGNGGAVISGLSQGTGSGQYTCNNAAADEFCSVNTDETSYLVGSEYRVDKAVGSENLSDAAKTFVKH